MDISNLDPFDIDPLFLMRLNELSDAFFSKVTPQSIPQLKHKHSRFMVYRSECPGLLRVFYDCLEVSNYKSCASQKEELEGCGRQHFRSSTH
jgi:hypothetical protein